ncbi:MAG: Holliday junction resolvase RuvX [Elioraea sp.]|nr:Holliday junction resolvase RuvX [Elioraea sp.]
MALLPLPALAATLPAGVRLLGIDLGAKRIGLALSDVGRSIASPYGSIPRRKLADTAAELVAIARDQQVGGLVVGLPLSLDGSTGPAAQAARDWAHAVSETTGLPTALWDERLSTAAVSRMLIGEADLSRRRRAKVVDAAAAAWVLQGALDFLRRQPAGATSQTP